MVTIGCQAPKMQHSRPQSQRKGKKGMTVVMSQMWNPNWLNMYES